MSHFNFASPVKVPDSWTKIGSRTERASGPYFYFLSNRRHLFPALPTFFEVKNPNLWRKKAKKSQTTLTPHIFTFYCIFITKYFQDFRKFSQKNCFLFFCSKKKKQISSKCQERPRDHFCKEKKTWPTFQWEKKKLPWSKFTKIKIMSLNQKKPKNAFGFKFWRC